MNTLTRPKPDTRPTPRRVARWIFFGLVAVTICVSVSFLPFFWPVMHRPAKVDAIVIPSGDHGERLALAAELVDRGVAHTVVFDGTIDRRDEIRWCDEGWRGAEAICLRPQPDSTRAEAQALGALARERRWSRIVIVTSTYHITRARLLFSRCVDADVSAVGRDVALPRGTVLRQILHEWAGTAWALTLDRKC